MKLAANHFKRFLLSYFLILLIPAVVGAYAYYQTVQVLRNDAVELNMAVLQQSEESLNRLLSEIRDINSLVSFDSDLLRLLLTNESEWSANTIYQFSLLRKELGKVTTNRFLAESFVYLRGTDAILSTASVERAASYPLHIGDKSFGDWLQQVTADRGLNRYYRLENVERGGLTGNYLAYVSELPSGSAGNPYGVLAILIDERSIVSTFGRLLETDGSFVYIADERDALIASSAPAGSGPVQSIQQAVKDGESYGFADIDDTRMLVTSARSFENGWTYVAGIPAETVLAKADYIKQINWAIALIALALTIVVALLFAYRSSKPVAELLESFRDLSTQMDKQLPVLQAAVVERLLAGGGEERELRSSLEQARLLLPGPMIAIAVVQIAESAAANVATIVSGQAAEQTDARKTARLFLSQHVGEYGFVHDMKGDRLALAVSPPPEAGAADALAAKLAGLQERLWQEFGIASAIGIGRMYGELRNLWRSCNEAVQALDYRVPDTPMQLLRYETIPHRSDRYYYPLDLELKLTNLVKTGDAEGLERLFEYIGSQNFEVRQLGPRGRKQLMQEMQGTLHKLVEQLSYSSGLQGLRTEQLDGLGLEEGGDADAFPRIQADFAMLCEYVRQHKSGKRQTLFESMTEYISGNYADSNLSLSQLADDFKQTESFMSTFFKEQMGMTFSEYVEKLRLDEACRLLRESAMPIQDIATRVGYNSDKSFRRAFKRAYGIQPTTYRGSQELS